MSCIVFAHPTVGMSNYLATHPNISVFMDHIDFGELNITNLNSRKHRKYIIDVKEQLQLGKVIFIPFRIDLIMLMIENELAFNICLPTNTPENKLNVLLQLVDSEVNTKTIENVNNSWDVIHRDVAEIDKAFEMINVWYVDSHQTIELPLTQITMLFNVIDKFKKNNKSDGEQNSFAN